MIIYKITNQVNGKVYIGQTIHTLSHRKSRHIECVNNGVDRHLYNAMRKYGLDNFIFEEIDHADNIEDLNYLESYYITKYDSVRNGYNMGYGGDNNVMFSQDVKTKHDAIMQSENVREKISKSMKAYRQEHPFTDEHRAKLSEKAKERERRLGHIPSKPKISKGNKLMLKRGDTRSIGCYCIDENGNKHQFHSYLDAGKWWYENYKPFPYSSCTYQRKIKQSIKYGMCTYGRGVTQELFYIPVWYEGGDIDYEVTDENTICIDEQ